MTIFVQMNMMNNIRHGVTSQYHGGFGEPQPVALIGRTLGIWDGIHFDQTTKDPGQQLRLGRAARSSLFPPLPFPLLLSLPLSFALPFLLNPGTGFGETL